MTARRHALEELERDRVGLAPAAAALARRARPIRRRRPRPAQRFRQHRAATTRSWPSGCSGDWMHAVLVRDHATVRRDPGLARRPAARLAGAAAARSRSRTHAQDGQPLDDRLRAEGPAAGWVRAALAGSEVLDTAGRVLRRASGAIFLSGAAAPSGPLRRRAELATLAQDVERGDRRAGRRRGRAAGDHRRGWPSASRTLAAAAAGGGPGAGGRAPGHRRPRRRAPDGRQSRARDDGVGDRSSPG